MDPNWRAVCRTIEKAADLPGVSSLSLLFPDLDKSSGARWNTVIPRLTHLESLQLHGHARQYAAAAMHLTRLTQLLLTLGNYKLPADLAPLTALERLRKLSVMHASHGVVSGLQHGMMEFPLQVTWLTGLTWLTGHVPASVEPTENFLCVLPGLRSLSLGGYSGKDMFAHIAALTGLKGLTVLSVAEGIACPEDVLGAFLIRLADLTSLRLGGGFCTRLGSFGTGRFGWEKLLQGGVFPALQKLELNDFEESAMLSILAEAPHITSLHIDPGSGAQPFTVLPEEVLSGRTKLRSLSLHNMGREFLASPQPGLSKLTCLQVCLGVVSCKTQGSLQCIVESVARLTDLRNLALWGSLVDGADLHRPDMSSICKPKVLNDREVFQPLTALCKLSSLHLFDSGCSVPRPPPAVAAVTEALNAVPVRAASGWPPLQLDWGYSWLFR